MDSIAAETRVQMSDCERSNARAAENIALIRHWINYFRAGRGFDAVIGMLEFLESDPRLRPSIYMPLVQPQKPEAPKHEPSKKKNRKPTAGDQRR